MGNKMIRELLKNGYEIFGKKITRMSNGARERYLLNLPQSDNEIWKLLRNKKITLYLEVSKEVLEKVKGKAKDHSSFIALQAFEKGIIRVGGRKISMMGSSNRERYAIYLTEGYKELWRILYENDVKVNVSIEIQGGEEEQEENF